LGYIFITQLLLPTIHNRKLFPIFRREGKLRSKIVDINQEIVEKNLAEEINKTIEKEGLE
jgi:hypothetical protein